MSNFKISTYQRRKIVALFILFIFFTNHQSFWGQRLTPICGYKHLAANNYGVDESLTLRDTDMPTGIALASTHVLYRYVQTTSPGTVPGGICGIHINSIPQASWYQEPTVVKVGGISSFNEFAFRIIPWEYYHNVWNGLSWDSYDTQRVVGGEVHGVIAILPTNGLIQLAGGIVVNNSTQRPNLDPYIIFPSDSCFQLRVGGTFAGGLLKVGKDANIANTDYLTPASITGLFTTDVYMRDSSLLGINLDYNNTANFHTRQNTDERGIIEIGESTRGLARFFIYAGGTLRNYGANNMHIGSTYGMPAFHVDGDSTMRIINRSNCKDLFFYNPMVPAITGNGSIEIKSLGITTFDRVLTLQYGTNRGDLHVAGAEVNFKDRVTYSSTAAQDAAVTVLALCRSCGNSNITAEKPIRFNHASNDGNLLWEACHDILLRDSILYNLSTNTSTAWLKFNAVNGNLDFQKYAKINNARNQSDISILAENIADIDSGNVMFHDSLIINRSGTLAGVTNIIAGNNLKTAMVDFRSQSIPGDETNIVSLMGDIYLGYITTPPSMPHTAVGYDLNRFTYSVPSATTGGRLAIRSGYSDPDDKVLGRAGGNIYFTHIDEDTPGNYDTEISIPFSNIYYHCNGNYEQAGIIGGVARCAIADTGLIYRGENGNLMVNAGSRGNIIINNGTWLNFRNGTGNASFLTGWGDIDMRNRFNAGAMSGNLLFYANSELSGKLNTGMCSCEERRNNVYLQDFEYISHANGGSIFIGADNNIKLQYGGLKDIGTQRDPFLSNNTGYNGVGCGTEFHCDADTVENKARPLNLNFSVDASNSPINSGGFAAVASDLIDIYKDLNYNGGNGTGMGTVSGYGLLHGEAVAGYGLYIKSQGNKDNYGKISVNEFNNIPCASGSCTDFLHQTSRVTFHADARIRTEGQSSYIGAPVLETYGNLELNTFLNNGNKTAISIQTDSLICHDSLIIDGGQTSFASWSGLPYNMPVFKLGHQRFTPPFNEGSCTVCRQHFKGGNGVDTIHIAFKNDASVPRLGSLVADHAVVTFLTDSFDHAKGNPVLNAKFYTDIFKIRNHVELFKSADHVRDGHFELISEEQMESKDYAGIYSRHLHLEPIAPACADFGYSELWLQDHVIDVITTSTLGGFGWMHADVHVETGANLFPGYTSLGNMGNCYERQAGVLKMQDLRLDAGANVKFSIGERRSSFVEELNCPGSFQSYELGGYSDCIDVDNLMIYGSVYLDIEIRPEEGLILSDDKDEIRCFPLIHYNSADEGVLSNLKLKKDKLTSKDHKSIEGTYYLTLDIDTACNVINLCIATVSNPVVNRQVSMPVVENVITNPTAGIYNIRSQSNFSFKVFYLTDKPLKITTGRIIEGKEEELTGVKNENGEYEYVLRRVTQNIVLSIGPDFATSNLFVDKTSVWSYDNMLYIKVDRHDVANIYSIAGQLVKQIELSEGDATIPLERGTYIVTLKDGSVHKVIIK